MLEYDEVIKANSVAGDLEKTARFVAENNPYTAISFTHNFDYIRFTIQ